MSLKGGDLRSRQGCRAWRGHPDGIDLGNRPRHRYGSCPWNGAGPLPGKPIPGTSRRCSGKRVPRSGC